MQSTYLGRRGFIKAAAAMAAGAVPGVLPLNARAQVVRNRPEWHEFRASSAYAGYLKAIAAMRANTNGSDRKSWTYWTNIHVSACPHGVPYFLAWHRGFLHYFQHVVRDLSGNSSLMLPYWDYYSHPELPAEFTDPADDNPLYVPGRKNTSVFPSLTLSPFLGRYTNFQRGLPEAFEPVIEIGPHGTFHNIIGGVMASMSSPMDPVFWLHHAQIDRLWSAWVAAGAGRHLPPLTDAYWSGYHTYTPVIKIARNMTYDTTSRLYYDYADKTLPASLPPPPEMAARKTVALSSGMPGERLRRPPTRSFRQAPPSEAGNRKSFGGARSIYLDENPVTAMLALDADDARLLRSVIEAPSPDALRGSAPRYRYVILVLDMARTTELGRDGGYFYDVYLNLPVDEDAEAGELLIGRFGAFEIDARSHHGRPARLSFPLTPVMRRSDAAGLRDLAVSFVRRSGSGSETATGTVITIGEMRVELANEPGG